jgi:hypothetical protein
MSIARTLKEASLKVLSGIFAAVGGLLGLLVMGIMEGWISIPIGVVSGLYVALFLGYQNVTRERDDARARLGGSRINPDIVNALLPRLRFAIHELSNPLDKLKSDQHRAWKEAMQKWEHETKEVLAALGCLESEISSFWDFTSSDLQSFGPLHNDHTTSTRKQWVQFRIRALRRIINNYSDRSVFID